MGKEVTFAWYVPAGQKCPWLFGNRNNRKILLKYLEVTLSFDMPRGSTKLMKPCIETINKWAPPLRKSQKSLFGFWSCAFRLLIFTAYTEPRKVNRRRSPCCFLKSARGMVPILHHSEIDNVDVTKKSGNKKIASLSNWKNLH